MKNFVLKGIFFLLIGWAALQAMTLEKFTQTDDAMLTKELMTSYPDIKMLCSKSEVTPEGSVGKPKDCQPSMRKELCGIFAVEFDRTLAGVLALKWLLDGDHVSFVAGQARGPLMLTVSSFKALKGYVENMIKKIGGGDENEGLSALITFLVINDLGKVEDISNAVAKKLKRKIVDHDLVLLEALKLKMSASYEALPEKYQQMILKGLESNFNTQQFVQGENIPGSLVALKDAALSKEELNLYLLHALFDTAGAAGHVNCAQGTIINEPTYKSFMQAFEALQNINTKSPQEVYDDYLAAKAQEWSTKDKLIKVNNKKTKALLRFALMARTNSSLQYQEIENIFNDSLPKPVQNFLIDQLARTGIDDVATLIYYAPAIVTNAIAKFGRSKGVKLALRLLYRIYAEALKAPNYPHEGIYTVNVSAIATAVKEQDITVLETMYITIRPVEDGAIASWRMVTSGRDLAKRKLLETEQIPMVMPAMETPQKLRIQDLTSPQS